MPVFCSLCQPIKTLPDVEGAMAALSADHQRGVTAATTVLDLYTKFKLYPPMVNKTEVIQALYRWRATHHGK